VWRRGPKAQQAARELEQRFLELTGQQGYEELGLSALTARSELEKTSGAGSDVVSKELVELDGEVFAPEGTPQVLTYAFDSPGRYSYVSKLMRGERIQRGRLREFTQLGVEEVSTRKLSNLQAASSLELMQDVLSGFDVRTSVGYLACEADLARLKDQLLRLDDVCADCQRRQGVNPVRMLDCKTCEKSSWPTFDTTACAACTQERDGVLAVLGGTVAWDPFMVRGLDYYQGLVWESTCGGLTVGAGGAYRAQVRKGSTKRDLNGAGWAVGLERLLLSTEEPELNAGPEAAAVMVTSPEDVALAKALAGARVLLYGNLKDALKRADLMRCSSVLILGARELSELRAPVKDLTTGEQAWVELSPS
jgi:histidyl-tRNA synthetase